MEVNFASLGYAVRADSARERIYYRYLGNTEHTIVLDKGRMTIRKYVKNTGHVVEMPPDQYEEMALEQLKNSEKA